MPAGEKKVAVVTGASRGVGRAVAGRLASMGHHVALVARPSNDLQQAVASLQAEGLSAGAHPCDLRDPEQIQTMARMVLGEHGRCDVLVNNAGAGTMGNPLHTTEPDTFDRLLATNLRAPYLLLRAFAPAMIKAGCGQIINIGSLAGKNPLPNGAVYAATKWGLLGMMLSAAEELREHGIRVSVVSPGSIATEFGHAPGTAADPQKDDSWKLAPEDVADCVAAIVGQSDRAFVSEILLRPLRKKKA